MIHVGIVTTLLIKAKHGPVAQKYKHVDIFTSICTPENPDQRDVCPTLSFVLLFFVLCVFSLFKQCINLYIWSLNIPGLMVVFMHVYIFLWYAFSDQAYF